MSLQKHKIATILS